MYREKQRGKTRYMEHNTRLYSRTVAHAPRRCGVTLLPRILRVLLVSIYPRGAACSHHSSLVRVSRTVLIMLAVWGCQAL